MKKYSHAERLFATMGRMDFRRRLSAVLQRHRDLALKGGIPSTLWGTVIFSPRSRVEWLPVNPRNQRVLMRSVGPEAIGHPQLMLLEALLEGACYDAGSGEMASELSYAEMLRRFGEAGFHRSLDLLLGWRLLVEHNAQRRSFSLLEDYALAGDRLRIAFSPEMLFLHLFDYLFPYARYHERIREVQEPKERLLPSHPYGVEHDSYRPAPIFWLLRAALSLPKVVSPESYLFRYPIPVTKLEEMIGRDIPLHGAIRSRMAFERMLLQVKGEEGKERFGFGLSPLTSDQIDFDFERVIALLPPLLGLSEMEKPASEEEAPREEAPPAEKRAPEPTAAEAPVPQYLFNVARSLRIPVAKIPTLWQSYRRSPTFDPQVEAEPQSEEAARRWCAFLAGEGYKSDAPNRGGWWNIAMDSKMEKLAKEAAGSEPEPESLLEEFERFRRYYTERRRFASNWWTLWKNWIAKNPGAVRRKAPETIRWDERFLAIAREEGWRDEEAKEEFRLFLSKSKGAGRRYEDWHEAWRGWLIQGRRFARERGAMIAGKTVRSHLEAQYYLARLVSHDIVRELRRQGVEAADLIAGKVQVAGIGWENYPIPPGLGRGQETLFYWIDGRDQAAAMARYAPAGVRIQEGRGKGIAGNTLIELQ